MKIFYIFSFLLFICYSSSAQTRETIRINSLNDNSDELTSHIYKYENFTPGKITFKDGATAEGNFNYHRLNGELHFITSKGDTMAVAHAETFKNIAIDKDTFYFNKGFLELVTHYEDVNIVKKQTLNYIGKEKKGAYGSYSTTASIIGQDSHINGIQTTKLELDENAIYTAETIFYFSDKYNNFFEANKRSFYDLFAPHEKQVKKFIKENSINFNREKDLLRLFEFAKSL